MAKVDRPAPAERIAVLEIKELPGRESRMDWAFLAGSSAGTLEAGRVVVRVVAREGMVRAGKAERNREAPGLFQPIVQ